MQHASPPGFPIRTYHSLSLITVTVRPSSGQNVFSDSVITFHTPLTFGERDLPQGTCLEEKLKDGYLIYAIANIN